MSSPADQHLPTQTLHEVTCPGCSLLCDDLTLRIEEGNLATIEPSCPGAEQYFRQPSVSIEDCRVDGQACSLEEAVAAAAKILTNATAPLFCGLGETNSESVRAILDLADAVGGIVDARHPTQSDPASRLLQTTGLVTTTLGEIAERADTILFWDCDFSTSNHRFIERLRLDKPTRFLPNGRRDRKLIAVGGTSSERIPGVDSQINFLPEQRIEFLHLLWSVGQNKKRTQPSTTDPLAKLAEQVDQLHSNLAQARYFVVVLGSPFWQSPSGRISLELLSRYVRGRHDEGRGAISFLRPGPNWVGAAGTLASRTACPGSVSLLQGAPQQDVDNFRATTLLAEKRTDAVFVLEGAYPNAISSPQREKFKRLPKIVLGHTPTRLAETSGVFLPVARPGWSGDGTMSRLDDIPLPLTKCLSDGLLSARQLAQRILEKTADALTARTPR